MCHLRLQDFSSLTKLLFCTHVIPDLQALVSQVCHSDSCRAWQIHCCQFGRFLFCSWFFRMAWFMMPWQFVPWRNDTCTLEKKACSNQLLDWMSFFCERQCPPCNPLQVWVFVFPSHGSVTLRQLHMQLPFWHVVLLLSVGLFWAFERFLRAEIAMKLPTKKSPPTGLTQRTICFSGDVCFPGVGNIRWRHVWSDESGPWRPGYPLKIR